ncbi:MAG: lysophospholipid acyltransferase family protein [Lentisphaerae bacterium]|nr:lysophospholipid acyltransferase family protein [Lentisphaerota bacterium]
MVRLFLRLTHNLIEKAIGLREIDRIYRSALSLNPATPFADRALSAIGVTYTYSENHLAKIPKTGPVVIVANHPYGGVEGVIMISLLKKCRPDVRIMANYILHPIKEMREDFIFVDPFGGAGATRANLRPIKECLNWLNGGGMLVVFPAGEVSSYDRQANRVRDKEWNPGIAAIIRKTQADVVPMFFCGRNGSFFNAAGVIHPRFRTILLVRELINKRGRRLLVRIGSPLKWHQLESVATDDKSLINYLRFRSYILDERATRRQRRLFLAHLPPSLPPEAIVPPEPVELQAKEIAALPENQKLVESGDLTVFIAKSRQIPAVLREIGRLREITFRAVGEGTGDEIDLDDFDYYYNHLFIWNNKRQEIIGSYRLGLADEIVAEHGVNGLYTRTLFKFDESLMERILPAVELGRSFVRPEYQKSFIALFLLWKGISAFIGQNPRYRMLFGPVSITNEYREASRGMILAAMRRTCMAEELGKLVMPRIPPKPPRRAEWCMPQYEALFNDLELVASFVAEIEPDGKDIPVLLRQYLKLGGKLLSFNVDPEFSSVVDGLILVDLLKAAPKTLRRYMGNEVADAYLQFHATTDTSASA